MTFANEFKTLRGITRVFLAGDFNAYSEEDPIQVLNAAGYTNLESTSDPDEESYNFDGQIGSLDHVLANAAALADVDGVDIWEINANESVYYEYSRFNYNVTNLYSDRPVPVLRPQPGDRRDRRLHDARGVRSRRDHPVRAGGIGPGDRHRPGHAERHRRAARRHHLTRQRDPRRRNGDGHGAAARGAAGDAHDPVRYRATARTTRPRAP